MFTLNYNPVLVSENEVTDGVIASLITYAQLLFGQVDYTAALFTDTMIDELLAGAKTESKNTGS